MEQAARRTLGPLKLYVIGGGAAIVLAAAAIHANYPKPVSSVLFAAGLAAIAYGALVHFKSASASIVLESRPLLGQALRGRILSGVSVMPEEVRVTMRCVHEWTEFGRSRSVMDLFTDSDRARYSRRQHETVWEESATITRAALRGSPQGFIVPFEFELPHDGHRTGYESDDQYRWEIDSRAAIPGVDFHAVFSLKVTR